MFFILLFHKLDAEMCEKELKEKIFNKIRVSTQNSRLEHQLWNKIFYFRNLSKNFIVL